MKAIILFKNTFLFFFVTVFTGLSFVCNAQSKSKVESQKSKDYQTQIQTGAEQTDKYLPLLKDKRVGILTNQTGIINTFSKSYYELQNDPLVSCIKQAPQKISIVDFLIENKINIQKIYAPEHGFRGTADAGELI